MNTTLEARRLCGGYGKAFTLQNADFVLPPGEITAVVGPNGSGKSTLLKLLGRLLRPVSGCVLLNGKEMSTFGTKEIARHLAILPQLRQETGELLVSELVVYGRFPHRRPFCALSAKDQAAIQEAITLMELEPLRRRPLSSLSGGERQRAWLAMTLAQESEILLLDEPTTFLDIRCQLQILERIREWNRLRHTTILMVLHDLNQALHFSDHLLMLKEGKILFSGRTAETLSAASIRSVFGIDVEFLSGSDGRAYCVAKGSAPAGGGRQE